MDPRRWRLLRALVWDPTVPQEATIDWPVEVAVDHNVTHLGTWMDNRMSRAAPVPRFGSGFNKRTLPRVMPPFW